MKINELEFFLVQFHCEVEPGPVRWLLVRLATDAGAEGWGESRLAWRPESLAARRETLLPVLAGRSIFDIEEILGLDVLRDPPLRSAVEMACWDLIGRTLRQPLCNLLGGGYRRRIPLAVRLPAASPTRAAQLAREWAQQGFHSQILACSGRPGEDVQTVVAVREATGDRVELRLDGAEGYDLQTARDLCADLEYARLQFFLDPLAAATLHEVAALGRQTSVPLGVCRAIHEPADVLALVRSGAGRFAAFAMEHLGGLAAARKCAAVAEAAGVRASLCCGPSPGLAVAAMLHLAAATPALGGCNECSYHQLEDDLLREPLEIIDGMITLPQGPGLGVNVDRAKIERYQVV
jgi:L-alanine-DL-glutamate epimerase-like enolase superfamily enzyme